MKDKQQIFPELAGTLRAIVKDCRAFAQAMRMANSCTGRMDIKDWDKFCGDLFGEKARVEQAAETMETILTLAAQLDEDVYLPEAADQWRAEYNRIRLQQIKLFNGLVSIADIADKEKGGGQ